jgi:hypothetical protein
MAKAVMEGLEVETDDFPERSGPIVRLGPLNVPLDLREVMEQIAEEEYRSISSVARMLIEYGLRYRERRK